MCVVMVMDCGCCTAIAGFFCIFEFLLIAIIEGSLGGLICSERLHYEPSQIISDALETLGIAHNFDKQREF